MDDGATSPKRRKYLTEFSLIVTVHVDVVGRQQDLTKVPLPSGERESHLYIVTRRPRISIPPESVQLTDTTIEGVVQLQRGPAYDEFPFKTVHYFGPGASWHSDWPHDEFAVLDAEGKRIAGGVVAHLSRQVGADWPREAQHHQVVYVGQAYGLAGERTAWDRLQRHETVQRIMAETSPDQQVWLSLAAVADINVMTEMNPHVPAAASDDEDTEHIKSVMEAVHDERFAEREAVALAEAGLIRFFQPAYNDRLKHAFPARTHTSLQTALTLDLHGLVVELQSEDVDAVYFSDVQPPRFMHFAGYAIHFDKDRAGTITLEACDTLPGLPIKSWND